MGKARKMSKQTVIILLPAPNEMLIRVNLDDFRNQKKMTQVYLNLKSRIETNTRNLLTKGATDVHSVN